MDSANRPVYWCIVEWLLLGLVLIGLALRLPDIQPYFQRNQAYLHVSRAIFGFEPYQIASSKLNEIAGQDQTRAAWAQARLASSMNNPAESYYDVILQNAEYIPLARAADPENVTLAEMAYKYHPDEARAVAWIADALSPTNLEEAAFYYQKATELEPNDDRNWRLLAQLAEWTDPQIAMEAAGTACHLNPVADGSCFREANVAFRLGEYERSVEAYVFLLKRNTALSPDNWAQYILALQHLGRSDEADRWFAEASVVAPADYGALFEKYINIKP